MFLHSSGAALNSSAAITAPVARRAGAERCGGLSRAQHRAAAAAAGGGGCGSWQLEFPPPACGYFGAALAALACATAAIAATGLPLTPAVITARELKGLTLEQLVQQEVVSVSRKPEVWSEVASSVVVITQDEMRRAGVTRIPEALRLAPNLNVAQVNSRDWAISARGFNNTLANKLLVMIDGRSIYTPLYSGVFWDVQDTFLPDLDRIEVISGPGATTWGANAVNGVINIITKRPEATQGWLAYGGGGSELRAQGGARYGGRIGEGFFRVYGQYADRDGVERAAGLDAGDDWHTAQGGFRATWGDRQNGFNVQGDVYDAHEDRPGLDPTIARGWNLLTRWGRGFSNGAQLYVRYYFDYTSRNIPDSLWERLRTHDFDMSYRFQPSPQHEFVTGASYRLMHDNVAGSASVAFLPEHWQQDVVSGFVQDQITLADGDVRVTLGSKFEHNDDSGFEYQPSARVAWLFEPHQTLWAAASRAVRAPSRVDRDVFVPGTPPYLVAGGPDFESEILWAYEAGYRGQPFAGVTLAATWFYHDYDELRSVEPQGSQLVFANGLEGRSYGAEVVFEAQATAWWRWRLGYAHLNKEIRLKPGSQDINQGTAEGNDPEDQFFLSSSFDLPHNVQLDLGLRRIDELPAPMNLPAYTELRCRLAWQASDALELALIGHNLLHDSHPEFGAANRAQIERSVLLRATWNY